MPKSGLLLISAGIDSPVAGFMMKKLGMDVSAIHFDARPFGDDKSLGKAKVLCRKIGIKRLFIASHGKLFFSAMKDVSAKRFTCVLCKRMMFRVAECLAEKEGFDFLITGDNLGQVASQTIENMHVTTDACKKEILRPLLGNDKQEIINAAKKIGTYETSIEKSVCCTAVPSNPATKASLNRVRMVEDELGADKIAKKMASEIMDIKL